jgi:inosine-uridine nucleoside N-ribohydrolase
LIIDTDPGLDDAFAIVTAHHFADVVGITSVGGNVGIDTTTTNALGLAALLGMDAPVHRGAAKPLVGEPRDAAHIHGESGMGTATLPPTDRVEASDDAAGFLVDATRVEEGLHIVAIGPLTNVALALQADPGLADRVASITIMGGSATSGNATATAEFNIYTDPEAAAIVFGSGAPITMAGLDLTHQVRLTPAHADELRALGTPVTALCADLLDSISTVYQRFVGRDDTPLHDTCAVLAVTHPHLFHGSRYPVAVELNGDLTRGMTVVDRRESTEPRPSNTTVLEHAEADAVRALILEAVTAS